MLCKGKILINMESMQVYRYLTSAQTMEGTGRLARIALLHDHVNDGSATMVVARSSTTGRCAGVVRYFKQVRCSILSVSLQCLY